MSSKYGNKKTVVDGVTFDSKKEARRYQELTLLQKSGAICDLEMQPKYVLVPKQRNAFGRAEREVTYVGDFRYIESGKIVIEDTKGFRTPDYIIKRKLMLHIHGITVIET